MRGILFVAKATSIHNLASLVWTARAGSPFAMGKRLAPEACIYNCVGPLCMALGNFSPVMYLFLFPVGNLSPVNKESAMSRIDSHASRGPIR